MARKKRRTIDEVRRHPRWGATKAQGRRYQETRDLKNRIHELETELAAKESDRQVEADDLAKYIFDWLEKRNGGELRDALEDQTVASRRRALEELAHILKHGGVPPNWVAGLATGKVPT